MEPVKLGEGGSSVFQYSRGAAKVYPGEEYRRVFQTGGGGNTSGASDGIVGGVKGERIGAEACL